MKQDESPEIGPYGTFWWGFLAGVITSSLSVLSAILLTAK
jgi:hypothetical protein